MRISVEIDIDESEINLATELLSVIRTVTDQVRVRQHGGKQITANGIHTPANRESPGQDSVTSPVSKPAAPKPSAPAPAPALAAPSAEMQGVDPAQRQALANYIRRAAEPDERAGVVNQLTQVLERNPETDKLFIAAYLEVLLSPVFEQPDASQKEAHAQFFQLVTALPESVRQRIQTPLTQQVIKIMTAQNNHHQRQLLLLPAVVFTTFLEMGLTNVRGMLRMVAGFLKTHNMIAVGVTMLGKSFEMCCAMVLSQASPASLTALTAQLDKLGPEYEYDITYLNGFLHWKSPSFRVLASRPKVHNSVISALAFDPHTSQLVSAGRNGDVIIYDEFAKPLARHKLPQHWAMGMLVNEQQREVIIAARPQGPQPSACLVTMSLDHPYEMKSSWTLKQTTLITCITMMPGSQSFVVGEQRKTPEGTHSIIAMYAIDQMDPNRDLIPNATIQSPGGNFACAASFSSSKQVLLTGVTGAGGPNGFVHLWKLPQSPNEAAAQVKTFSLPPDAGFPTCLAQDGKDILVAGTSQKQLVQWSMKSLHSSAPDQAVQAVRSFQLDNYALQKIQFWPNESRPNQLAAMTAHGLWHVDLSGDVNDGKPFAQHVQDVPADDITYSAMDWAGHFPHLYVGGQSQVVNICQLVL